MLKMKNRLRSLGKLLISIEKTICTAESCTGGQIAHMITSVPGSSSYYKGSVVAYANSAKSEILTVPDEIMDKYGAVSKEVVSIMAEQARLKFRTDFAVATSGIAGPDGGTDEKPVGTLWIAVAAPDGVNTEKRVFGNERKSNIKRFSLAALSMLRKQIINH